MGKKRVEFFRQNWDICMMTDLMNHTGFLITEPAVITVDEEKVKTKYGPRSYLYGDTYSNEQDAVEMRYRCDCGKTRSHQNEGKICKFCGSKVVKRSTDIKITGWISLGKYKIINPYYAVILKRAFERDCFEDIINPKKKVDKNGNIQNATENDLNVKPSSPYYGIGIEEFIERYDEIIDYFMGKNKKRTEDLEVLKSERAKVFTSSIPIYSTMMRPQSMTSDSFYYGGLDKQINPLFSLSEILQTSSTIDRPLILYRCQQRVNTMFAFNLDQLTGKVNGKDGFIRKNIQGGPLNFTARNVITPDYTLKINEIDIPYRTALELFRYQIISMLVTIYGMSYAKANNKWHRAIKFDQEIYDIMMTIIKIKKVRILINRNPTLHMYSMLTMKIRKVKSNTHDMTLSLPQQILPGLNADFDGDILNMIALLIPEVQYIFRKYDPLTNMMISKSTGELNSYFALDAGTISILYDYSNIGDDYQP